MLGRVNDLAPGFLIATPQLDDPAFARSVVLILEHSDEGAVGIVVNRLSPMKLGALAEEQGLEAAPGRNEDPVFVGGPVQRERGFVLHDQAELADSVQVSEGLFVSSSMEALRALMTGTAARFRLCLGYAGWDAGQLEQELQAGAWLCAPLDAVHALDTPPERTWNAVLQDLGVDPARLQHAHGLH